MRSLLFVVFFVAQDLINNIFATAFITASVASPGGDLCNLGDDIYLDSKGRKSAAIINLSSVENSGVCVVRVLGPPTHLINMQFINPEAELQKVLNITPQEHRNKNKVVCDMSIYLPDNNTVPYWRGDLCSSNVLPGIDLLTSDFTIFWTPPSDLSVSIPWKLVLTAVGQGVFCRDPSQHTCMKTGWLPLYCVWNHLLCDGYPNCPKGSISSDEDNKYCMQKGRRKNSWQQLALTLFELRDQFQTTTPKKTYGDWREWQGFNKKVSTPKTMMESKKPDTISQILSKYGPWGYLMLGMLICGTVLMFCGLWECCIRKPKTTDDTTASVAGPPTTVLIISQDGSQMEPGVIHPPNYDELDQPPSYTTLFGCGSLTLNSKSQASTSQVQTIDVVPTIDATIEQQPSHDIT